MAGFSLLEILVAFVILSLSLATVLGVFSTGLRAAARGEDYSRAVALAETKLAAMANADPLRDGVEEGEFDDRYRWRTVTRAPPWWTPPTGHPLRPYVVVVDVSWAEPGLKKAQSVSLTTLRLVSAQ